MAPIVTPSFEEPSGLEPGSYRAMIIGCETKISKKGSPYLNWKFEELSTHSWIFLMTGLSGKGAQMLKHLVKCAGFPHYEGGPINTDELLGNIVTVKIDRLMNADGTPGKYTQVVGVEIDGAAGEDFDDFK